VDYRLLYTQRALNDLAEIIGYIAEDDAEAASPVESHVIPAKAGIQLAEVDPRLRGGDVLTFISSRGPQAHVRSE
jgi:plasmid stabilization system protein ParE